MAHEIKYFCRTDRLATDMISTLVSAAAEFESVADRTDFSTWCSVEFHNTGGSVMIVEVHEDDVITSEAIESFRGEDGAPDLRSCNRLVAFMLSGSGVDVPLFEKLRRIALGEWAGVEYDEVGGFHAEN